MKISKNYNELFRKNRLFIDSFWAIAGSMIGRGLSLLAGIIVARFLGKELYGEYGTIKNTLTYAAILSSFGFGYSATKFLTDYLSHNPDKVRSLVRFILNFTMLIGVLLSLLVTFFSSTISVFLEAPHLSWPLKYFSMLIFFNALTTTQTALLSGFKHFKELAYINGISGFVTFLTSVFMTYYYGINGAIVALLISFIVQTVLSQHSINKSLKEFHGKEIIQRKDIRSLISFSIPIALQESLYTVVHWIELLLMIKLANYGEVGLSSAAATWKSIVIFIPGVLKNVMFSYLTSSDNHQKLVGVLLKYNLFASFLPSLLFIACSHWIVNFYGSNFDGLTYVLIVSLASAVIISVSEVFCYEFISTGKPWTVFMARMTRDGLTLLFTFILLLNINHHQAFYCTLIGAGCQMIFLVSLFVIYKKSN